MPDSPSVHDRTWVGTALMHNGALNIRGASRPWDGTHDRAQLLLLDERGPLRWLCLSPHEFTEEYILSTFEEASSIGFTRPIYSPPANTTVSVAVCTRDRPDDLVKCLERIRIATKDTVEVLVVDNAPRSDATQFIIQRLFSDGMNVRSVVEPRAGLARARNRALREARSTYVAFVDDDARPEPNWLDAIHRGFGANPEVAVVTGLVPPAELESRAQVLFEQKVKWSNNLVPEIFSLSQRETYPWPFPYSAGHFGTGANFAIHRRTALEVGGFDEALGAGARTTGGEDMEMFVRIVLNGYQLAYQPSAIVWHIHRRTEAALRKVIFGYGAGLSATALSEFLRPGKLAMVRSTLRGARNLANDRKVELEYGMDWEHLVIEVLGILYGPLAYFLERSLGPRGS